MAGASEPDALARACLVLLGAWAPLLARRAPPQSFQAIVKLKRKTLGFLLGVVATLAAVFVLSLVFREEYPSRQTAKRTFMLDEDFTAVRKILVRNDAAKQIVTMGGSSEYISDDMESIGLDAGKPLDELLNPDWRLHVNGTLRVRTKDDYVGRHEIALAQDIEITPDFLHSESRLKEPKGRLKEYDMKTYFDRDQSSGNARVSLELTQQILTEAPFWAHGIADRRVRQSAEKTLANQEAAIRKLIAEHIEDVPLFPLR
jgi:hypothetical protein